MVRTRFAPSPTGSLHIGGLRTALYAYLLAKKEGGQFILRIEDTDQKRFVEGAIENIIDSLKWAGITPDEGPTVGGDHGPYIQSERTDLYKKYTQQLLDDGHAYRCFCKKEDLDKMREDQIAMKKAPMYDRRCRHLSEEEIQAKLDAGEEFVIRQAIPLNQLVKFEDIVRGKTKFDTNTLDDHVLMKSDGFPTYHLAMAVDDHLMECTHVIRGEEWLPSTPKHILLFEAFGWEVPQFAHLSLMLNKDRSKLSKRNNDVSTQQYIDKGYLKEALVNFVALIGWNNSDNQELYSMEELIEAFDLSGLQKAGAIFDLDKLNWFQWQWKRRLHLEDIEAKAIEIDPQVEITEPKKGHRHFAFSSPELESQFIHYRGAKLKEMATMSDEILAHEANDPEFFAHALVSIEEKILKEPENTDQNIAFYFKDELDYDKTLLQKEKMGIDEAMANKVLEIATNELEEADFKSEDILKAKLISLIEKHGLKTGQMMWPLRVALTGEEFSPGAIEVGVVLGYDKSMERLKISSKF